LWKKEQQNLKTQQTHREASGGGRGVILAAGNGGGVSSICGSQKKGRRNKNHFTVKLKQPVFCHFS